MTLIPAPFGALPANGGCRFCGAATAAPAFATSIGRPPWLAQVCDARACQAQAQNAEASRVRRNRTRALERLVPGADAVAFVPVNQRALGRSSKRRQRAFVRHLELMLDDASAEGGGAGSADGGASAPEASEPEASAPMLSPTLAQVDLARVDGAPVDGPAEVASPDRSLDLAAVETACGACRGFCCTTTGTDAWITPSTMRRVQRSLPGLDREALVARYVAQLPARSYRDSCVYHAAGGCRLEATLRSDTCHRYVCDGVTSLVGLVRARGAAGVGNADVRVAATVDSRVVRVSRVPRVPVAHSPDAR